MCRRRSWRYNYIISHRLPEAGHRSLFLPGHARGGGGGFRRTHRRQRGIVGGLDDLERAVGRRGGVLVGVHQKAQPPVLPLDVVVGDGGRGPWVGQAQAQHGVPVGRGGVHIVGHEGLLGAMEARREVERVLRVSPGARDVARQEALLRGHQRPPRLRFHTRLRHG